MTRFPTPHHVLALTLLGTLAACGNLHDDYPDLVPMEQLLAEPAVPAHASGAIADPVAAQDNLDRQAAALRARANALRRPVIDAATTARMRNAQARHN